MQPRVHKKIIQGLPLAIQWLRHRASSAGGWVPSLVGELGSHMLHNTAKKKKKNITDT